MLLLVHILVEQDAEKVEFRHPTIFLLFTIFFSLGTPVYEIVLYTLRVIFLDHVILS